MMKEQGPSLIGRRHFLSGAGLILASGLIIPSAALGVVHKAILPLSSKEKILKFHNRHTRENLEVLFCRETGYCTQGLEAIDHMMRDHRTNVKVPIDLKLIEGLFKLTHLLETKLPIEIVCGYRSHATNRMLRQKNKRVAQESYHLKGQAVDIRIRGISIQNLQKAAKSLQLGGVGYYPRAGFIHIDTGPKRYW